MGLGDFLKKAADTATKKAAEAYEAASKKVEEAKANVKEAEERKREAEAARQKEEQARKEAEKAQQEQAHMAAYEAEREARRQKLESYKALPPSCDKGDCAMCYGDFYYSCPEDCECRRKKLVDNQHKKPLPNPAYMPYMKWVEALSRKIREEGPQGYTEDGDENLLARQLGGEIHLPLTKYVKPGDTEEISCFGEVAATFVENQLPNYSDNFATLIARLPFKWHIYGFENSFLRFLTRAHEEGLDYNVVPYEFFEMLGGDIIDRIDNVGLVYIHIDKDFYYNPSLYQRSKEDLEYTLLVLELISEPSYFWRYHPDADFEPEKFMAMMLDENGNIKPAGQGGPEKGEWGDTINNTLVEIEGSLGD